jgi:hypothetical protein
MIRRRALLLLILAVSPGHVTAQTGGALLVRIGDEWEEWWDGSAPPPRWTRALDRVADAAGWTAASAGVDRGELTIRRVGEPWRVRVVLVRIDPSLVDLRLVVPPRRDDGFSGRWSIDEAPPGAVFAVNAGQFTGGPWGWLVQGGERRQPAGTGALAPGVAVDRSGAVALLPRDSLEAATGVEEGFQSYPALLIGDGVVPPALLEEGRGVDLVHRDGRLALGLLRDGRVVVALTRMEGLGGLLEIVPFGPTTPEMAALMGALGCTRAVLLDGGLSGQMMLVEDGRRVEWRGLRQVAAGLVGMPRMQAGGAR